jgi:ABC-type nitrate/sulfonate/bicarbonate transport system substrate-binding protein
MRRSKRLLALLSASLAFATVLTSCGGDGGGDDAAGGGGETASIPKNADEVDATIDTSKVKKSIIVAVDNPYYLFHVDVLVAQDKGYFKEVGIDNVEIVTVEDPLPALIGGSVDFALYDTDTTIAAANKSKAGSICRSTSVARRTSSACERASTTPRTSRARRSPAGSSAAATTS